MADELASQIRNGKGKKIYRNRNPNDSDILIDLAFDELYGIRIVTTQYLGNDNL